MDRLHATLDALGAEKGSVTLPVFDKAIDDRLPEPAWRQVELPVDLVILEGWCVGTSAEPSAALETPVNSLERDRDEAGTWRRYVNSALGGEYARLNDRLDALIYIEVPDMAAVTRWRSRQEQELREDRGGGMSASDVAGFVSYFERLTLHGLRTLPGSADIVISLDESHGIAGVRLNRAGTRES